MSFNFTPADPRTLRDLPEDGKEYDFIVLGADQRTSRSGNAMLEISIGLFNDPADEIPRWRLREYLIAPRGEDDKPVIRRIYSFCAATGLLDHYKAGTLTTDIIIERTGKLKVRIEEDEQFGPKARVGHWIPREGAKWEANKQPGTSAQPVTQNAPSTDDDQVPF